jgi:DNA-binding NtrC family response regulator
MPGKILVIDDETSMLAVIEAMLINENYEVETFEDARAGIEHFREHGADCIISDIRMEPVDGITVLKETREINPEALVILITAFANAQDALEALKVGAYDYIQKPFKMEKLRALVRRALTVNRIIEESQPRKTDFPRQECVAFHGILTRNPVMKKLFDLVKKAAPSRTTILIQGESGTGKELFARAIHMNSDREKEPFVPINCGALPEQLLESELFGHVKGAFTGAVNNKIGLFKAAGEGTLFLDEISSLSLNLQAKLLRVLQEKEIRPVGSVDTQKIHCRVIAATNVSLEELITRKSFREDLYYRLNIIPIEIPPLRERSEDLSLLIDHFLKRFAPGKPFRILPTAMNILLEYHWPGNVRELENTIERVTTLCSDGEVGHEDLPPFIKSASTFGDLDPGKKILPLKVYSAMAEGQYIHSVLHKLENDKALAAKFLDVDIATINRKLERFERIQNS